MTYMEEMKARYEEVIKEMIVRRIFEILEDYEEGCYPELHACTYK